MVVMPPNQIGSCNGDESCPDGFACIQGFGTMPECRQLPYSMAKTDGSENEQPAADGENEAELKEIPMKSEEPQAEVSNSTNDTVMV
jgi:hypothetical protein